MRRVLIGLAIVGLALLAGCAKSELSYPELEAKYATPASRFADLPGGVHVHYRDQGPPTAARTLVLVHGFAASLQAWEPWVARLAPSYRVISLDLPGHGLTAAPAGYRASTEGDVALIDALTQRLGARRFVLAGNSMGGGIAWAYALKHPERLEGLVLVDAAGWPHPQAKGGPPVFVFKLLGNPVGRAILAGIDPTPMARKGLQQAYVDPALVTPDLIARYVDFTRAPGHREILLNQNSGPRAPVTPDTFKAIRTPTLVMVGAVDAVIPPDDSRGLAGAIPGARLIVYPGVGHVPMEQIPDESAADLKAFVDGLPTG
ncbi:alpha/beta fold hydrolase [Phenylobacterium sp.]|uniref:alpha/beta fold hydrolase n=1 Tax=Phenylobacterium sp. TaxID=1871053 RepID=UPI00374D4B45